jgi:CubicO group peptidase (beta-lactamase class C family)
VSAIAAFLRSEMDVGSFPGASWAIGTTDGIDESGAIGHAVAVPFRIDASEETIYDCASLTKPLVTGVLALQAVAEGKVRLEDEYRGFTWRELLTHTSGLRAWMPLYAFDAPLKAIEKEGREAARGEKVIYSDLNFVLLYHALQELFGDYVTAAVERIFRRLALRDAWLSPPQELRPRIAATEWGQAYEQKMCSSRSVVFHGFRRGLIWGETHDGNSFHAGGTCGNAGLFATAADVFRIVQAFARGELVPIELVHEATRNLTPGLGEARGLGWQLAGPGLSQTSWGHTGFTGTSAWVDGGRIMVLLTNRVHPCAAPIAMQTVRAGFHRAATERRPRLGL